jgi:hypothetical protein
MNTLTKRLRGAVKCSGESETLVFCQFASLPVLRKKNFFTILQLPPGSQQSLRVCVPHQINPHAGVIKFSNSG